MDDSKNVTMLDSPGADAKEETMLADRLEENSPVGLTEQTGKSLDEPISAVPTDEVVEPKVAVQDQQVQEVPGTILSDKPLESGAPNIEEEIKTQQQTEDVKVDTSAEPNPTESTATDSSKTADQEPESTTGKKIDIEPVTNQTEIDIPLSRQNSSTPQDSQMLTWVVIALAVILFGNLVYLLIYYLSVAEDNLATTTSTVAPTTVPITTTALTTTTTESTTSKVVEMARAVFQLEEDRDDTTQITTTTRKITTTTPVMVGEADNVGFPEAGEESDSDYEY